MAVIVVVPFVVGHGLAIGGVMAEAYVTEVVGHSKAVIDQLVLLALITTKDELTQIEAFQREVDQSVELGSTDAEAILTLSSLETFESDD